MKLIQNLAYTCATWASPRSSILLEFAIRVVRGSGMWAYSRSRRLTNWVAGNFCGWKLSRIDKVNNFANKTSTDCHPFTLSMSAEQKIPIRFLQTAAIPPVNLGLHSIYAPFDVLRIHLVRVAFHSRDVFSSIACMFDSSIYSMQLFIVALRYHGGFSCKNFQGVHPTHKYHKNTQHFLVAPVGTCIRHIAPYINFTLFHFAHACIYMFLPWQLSLYSIAKDHVRRHVVHFGVSYFIHGAASLRCLGWVQFGLHV